MSKPMLSLADLDVTKKCEQGFEFEYIDKATGKGTGFFLTVIGAHAPAVTGFSLKYLNERRAYDAMNERRGKQAKVRPIEEDIEFSTEMTAIRVIGWRGIKEEYSPENAIALCRGNP